MQLELQVKVMPIRKATKQAFEDRLRELREDGECPYKVVDSINGIYEKQNP